MNNLNCDVTVDVGTVIVSVPLSLLNKRNSNICDSALADRGQWMRKVLDGEENS
jgi:hypothetical protein